MSSSTKTKHTKLKTHSGAKKRFKVTATGKVMVKGAKVNHILTKKTSSYKRSKRKLKILKPSDAKRVKKLLLL